MGVNVAAHTCHIFLGSALQGKSNKSVLPHIMHSKLPGSQLLRTPVFKIYVYVTVCVDVS